MPLYELCCIDCGNEFTVLQKMNDPIPECPSCQSDKVEKQISSSSFRLKGGGCGWEKEGYNGEK